MTIVQSPQQIRSILINYCLSGSNSSSRVGLDYHRNLTGICGFYLLTSAPALLRYYSLQNDLAIWLRRELEIATSQQPGNSIKLITTEADFNNDEDEWNDETVSASGATSRRERRIVIDPLYAMRTTADGNCLLHAISICLWGVEDCSTDKTEVSIIRKGLKAFMLANKQCLFLHFKAAERRFDASILGGIETPESDLLRQMDYEIACLDDNSRYLTAMHVYCLANMLRRPIIVYCEPNPNGVMRGIYCPTM